jgi:hypothetical protein
MNMRKVSSCSKKDQRSQSQMAANVTRAKSREASFSNRIALPRIFRFHRAFLAVRHDHFDALHEMERRMFNEFDSQKEKIWVRLRGASPYSSFRLTIGRGDDG